MTARSLVPIAGLLVGSVAGAGSRERPEAATAPRPVDRPLGLMPRRPAVRHDVARWTWAIAKPIADPARAAQGLGAVAERGRGRGLDAKLVRGVFAAPMEASTPVPQADLDRRRARGDVPGEARRAGLIAGRGVGP